MSTGKIYKIINLKNNKLYIGKTIKDLDVRFKEHITTANRWKKEEEANKRHPYNSRLYPSMNKYGYDNFKISLIEELPDDAEFTLEQREQYWIAQYNTTDPTVGYNISPGGFGGPLFTGHKQSDYCKYVNSKKAKGIKQDSDFVKKRSYARARLMQDLDSGEVFSILDLGNGYFYKQDFTTYRIYKSNNKFYACLEQPHNRKALLDAAVRTDLLAKLANLVDKRREASVNGLQAGLHNLSVEKRLDANRKISDFRKSKQKEQLENFMLENKIDINQYKSDYLKYKDECPNKHLELIYKISYTKVRALNRYLGLSGGRSGHKRGKVTIEANN